MSLDVTLLPANYRNTSQKRAVKLLRDNGFEAEADYLHGERYDPDAEESFSANITHNLNSMAAEAGIYKHLWCPEELEITRAGQLIEPLRIGLDAMKADPAHFKAFDAKNGWGLYENFVPWIERYLQACRQFPDHEISVSR